MKKLLLPLAGIALLSATLVAARRDSGGAAASLPVAASRGTSASGHRVSAEGRIVTYPGDEVVVGTDLAGTLQRLPVTEKSVVKKGALVAEILADEQRAALQQARARIVEADSDIKLAELELERARNLYEKKVGAKQPLDQAERNLDAARARKSTAVHDADRLAAIVAKARITSPIDGVVLARHAQPGETVDRGARLVTIANLDRTRIEAEVDEFDAGRVALGAPVRVKAEGWREAWKGVVEEIPDSVGPRRVKPEDPGKPSDTRVLLVKIAFQEKTPLKLGQRVEVEISGR
jgi:RND family efflux transporter MFP subunit